MAEYVFTLRNVRKAHGDKVVLDNVTLSFLHGAKIGVVGPNGTGKSSLLKIMAGLDHANNGDAILDPDATVGMLQQEPPLTRGQDRPGERRGGRARASRPSSTRFDEVYEEIGDPDADYDTLLTEIGRPPDRPRPRERLGHRQPARPGDGRAALPAARRARRQPVRWRAAPGGAVQAAAPAAVDLLLLDEPTNHLDAESVDWLEKHLGGLPRRGPGRHPRPLLPRQRRAVDPRARPRPDPPLRGQLLDLPRDQEGPPQDRGPEGRQARQDARARAGVGALERQGPPDQEQVAAGALRGDGGRGRPDAQDRHQRDQHPGRSAARRRRARGEEAGQGLRRPDR